MLIRLVDFLETYFEGIALFFLGCGYGAGSFNFNLNKLSLPSLGTGASGQHPFLGWGLNLDRRKPPPPPGVEVRGL